MIVIVTFILTAIPLRLLLTLGPRPCLLLLLLPLPRCLGGVVILLALLPRPRLRRPAAATATQQCGRPALAACWPAATARRLLKLPRPAASPVYSRVRGQPQRLPWRLTISAGHAAAARAPAAAAAARAVA